MAPALHHPALQPVSLGRRLSCSFERLGNLRGLYSGTSYLPLVRLIPFIKHKELQVLVVKSRALHTLNYIKTDKTGRTFHAYDPKEQTTCTHPPW